MIYDSRRRYVIYILRSYSLWALAGNSAGFRATPTSALFTPLSRSPRIDNELDAKARYHFSWLQGCQLHAKEAQDDEFPLAAVDYRGQLARFR